MNLYDEIEQAIDTLPDSVDRDWTVWMPEKGYPQRVLGKGNVVIVCEVYEDPQNAPGAPLAHYLALVSPANVQKLLFELKAGPNETDEAQS